MFPHQGICVSSWVNLDGSCKIEADIFGENLQLQFGPEAQFGLVVPDTMVPKLAAILAEAEGEWRQEKASGHEGGYFLLAGSSG